MNTEITQNIILDLLPLYLSGEASADSAALVEKYLEANPELAKSIKQGKQIGLSEVPVPLFKDDAMKAYIEANQRMIYRTLLIGAAFVVGIMVILYLVVAVIQQYQLTH
jgi:hypothetical protein